MNTDNHWLLSQDVSLTVFFFLVAPADDFESKFNFHPLEDLPPPEEFRHFNKVYPSKGNKCESPMQTQHFKKKEKKKKKK